MIQKYRIFYRVFHVFIGFCFSSLAGLRSIFSIRNWFFIFEIHFRCDSVVLFFSSVAFCSALNCGIECAGQLIWFQIVFLRPKHPPCGCRMCIFSLCKLLAVSYLARMQHPLCFSLALLLNAVFCSCCLHSIFLLLLLFTSCAFVLVGAHSHFWICIAQRKHINVKLRP